jgi:competence protein ComFC
LLEKQYCLVCGKITLNGLTHEKCKTILTPDQLYCSYIYENIVRDCIRSSKFKRKEFALLSSLLGKSLATSSRWFMSLQNYTMIPVPISKERYKERGFNQTDLIAQYLAKCFKNIKVDPQLLRRKNNTKAQYENDRQSRFKNVEDAFVLSQPEKVEGKNYLIVDDIVSSGATFLEISKTFKSAGAGNVKCYALSRRLLE